MLSYLQVSSWAVHPEVSCFPLSTHLLLLNWLGRLCLHVGKLLLLNWLGRLQLRVDKLLLLKWLGRLCLHVDKRIALKWLGHFQLLVDKLLLVFTWLAHLHKFR